MNKSPKTYKAIWLPEKLAIKVKALASKKNLTTIQFIENLLSHPTLLKP